jgi:thioredoxin-dependent peroxiredoxin
MIRTLTATVALAITLPTAVLAQQQQAAIASPGPQVGDVAPQFTLPGATRDGVRSTPVSLAELKGKTVVIAFFPAARTSGCTVQMQAYRDQYEKLFRGGKDVVVVGISADADTTLANWAKESNFPMLFASDSELQAAALYGSKRPTGKYVARNLFVVGPDGKITHKITPFNVMSQDAYAELGKAVEAATGAK